MENVKITPECDKVSLELGHCVLSETPRTKADSLAKRTYPRFILVAVNEVFFIIGL